MDNTRNKTTAMFAAIVHGRFSELLLSWRALRTPRATSIHDQALSFSNAACKSSQSLASLFLWIHDTVSMLLQCLPFPLSLHSSERSFMSRRSSNVSLSSMDPHQTFSGLVFEPFEELKHELALIPSMPDQSIARQHFSDDCETALNQQINVEYNVSYAYHAMFAYFDRDNVALRGFAKFFKKSTEAEREHAEKLIEYQNKRRR